ncbi:MAG: S8 family peptidase [Lachnospiraceae bacterium]|nr:S8 family peptidase [Lachnospiraceae bacterium]
MPYSLTGKGILVACVDSGIDYAHPDFRNANGSTRLVAVWDQSIGGRPPEGYDIGTEYTSMEIDAALKEDDVAQRYALVPTRDVSGHGTAVMGVAGGNGSESGGAYRGIAYESDLLVVKLGVTEEDSFPRTTELIQGIDYCIRTAIRRNQPLALNISFGNSYGSHEGNSLLETYLTTAMGYGRNTACAGTGNEGNARGHTSGTLQEGQPVGVELSVGTYQTGINIQIWKNYVDQINIELIAPDGSRIGPIRNQQGTARYSSEGTELLVYYGEPSPYSTAQEIYLDFLPRETYLATGVWTIRLIPERIVDGEYDLWLPGAAVRNADTVFYLSNPQRTLTIPSAAEGVIAVGAYDSRLQSYASFSGRGYTRVTNQIKPDLVAPGVAIQTARAGGGYAPVTGTSFATPFVTGSAALLMEWGIGQGNDPYLYGEKVKAYLRRGARHLPGFDVWPNPEMGYGALCVRESIPF